MPADLQPNPTTGYYSVLNYTVPGGGIPLNIREGIVRIVVKYEPARISASTVIMGGSHRLTANSKDVNALKGFNEGEIVNFETDSPDKISIIQADLEKLLQS